MPAPGLLKWHRMSDAPISRLPCIEAGCDRPAAVGAARCELHASRLGPIPRAASAPPVASAPKILDVSPASPLSSWREQRFSGRFAVAAA